MVSPLVVTRRKDLREALAASTGRVGFVPTLGALHEGHASLLRASRARTDTTVLSVFVNPKQFGAGEDFGKYPRTFNADLALAKSEGVDIVFAPTAQEMYPEGFRSHARVSEMDSVLDGVFRPGHFDGVCTVVLLLLNLVGAHEAYFGLKDLQQVCILKRMCADLAHPTAIVALPTVREDDGLALSSRNRYLTDADREVAKAIPRALGEAARCFLAGTRDVSELVQAARGVFDSASLSPQYLEARSTSDLRSAEGSLEDAFARGDHVALAVAQIVGTTRLIDNIVFAPDDEARTTLEDLAQRTST